MKSVHPIFSIGTGILAGIAIGAAVNTYQKELSPSPLQVNAQFGGEIPCDDASMPADFCNDVAMDIFQRQGGPCSETVICKNETSVGSGNCTTSSFTRSCNLTLNGLVCDGSTNTCEPDCTSNEKAGIPYCSALPNPLGLGATCDPRESCKEPENGNPNKCNVTTSAALCDYNMGLLCDAGYTNKCIDGCNTLQFSTIEYCDDAPSLGLGESCDKCKEETSNYPFCRQVDLGAACDSSEHLQCYHGTSNADLPYRTCQDACNVNPHTRDLEFCEGDIASGQTMITQDEEGDTCNIACKSYDGGENFMWGCGAVKQECGPGLKCNYTSNECENVCAGTTLDACSDAVMAVPRSGSLVNLPVGEECEEEPYSCIIPNMVTCETVIVQCMPGSECVDGECKSMAGLCCTDSNPDEGACQMGS